LREPCAPRPASAAGGAGVVAIAIMSVHARRQADATPTWTILVISKRLDSLSVLLVFDLSLIFFEKKKEKKKKKKAGRMR
jgi:hypothetical protein